MAKPISWTKPGGDVFEAVSFSDFDVQDIMIKNPGASWFERAVNNPGKSINNKTVYSVTSEVSDEAGNTFHIVVPTVREDGSGNLYEISDINSAIDMSVKNKDFILADSKEEAEFISKGFSSWQGRRKKKKKGK